MKIVKSKEEVLPLDADGIFYIECAIEKVKASLKQECFNDYVDSRVEGLTVPLVYTAHAKALRYELRILELILDKYKKV